MSPQDALSLIVIVLVAPVIIGIISGLKDKAVIYRDYNDLWLVFLAIILPFVFLFIYAALETDIVLLASCIGEVFVIGKIVQRTFQDNNKDILITLLALYTKLPLGILFVSNAFFFLCNLTRPSYKRYVGFWNLLSLICLTPLIMRLVKNKTGLFS